MLKKYKIIAMVIEDKPISDLLGLMVQRKSINKESILPPVKKHPKLREYS